MRICYDWVGMRLDVVGPLSDDLTKFGAFVSDSATRLHDAVGTLTIANQAWSGDAATAFGARWAGDKKSLDNTATLAGTVGQKIGDMLKGLIYAEANLESVAGEVVQAGLPIDPSSGLPIPGSGSSSPQMATLYEQYLGAYVHWTSYAEACREDLLSFLGSVHSLLTPPPGVRDASARLDSMNDQMDVVQQIVELPGGTADAAGDIAHAAAQDRGVLSWDIRDAKNGSWGADDEALRNARAAFADANSSWRSNSSLASDLGDYSSHLNGLDGALKWAGRGVAVAQFGLDGWDDLSRGDGIGLARDGVKDIGGFIAGDAAGEIAGAFVAGAILTAGGPAIAVAVGGAITALVVGYGVSDLIGNVCDEDWAGDIKRDGAWGIATGAGHAVTQTLGDFGNTIGGALGCIGL
jgi:hypothetical protein